MKIQQKYKLRFIDSQNAIKPVRSVSMLGVFLQRWKKTKSFPLGLSAGPFFTLIALKFNYTETTKINFRTRGIINFLPCHDYSRFNIHGSVHRSM